MRGGHETKMATRVRLAELMKQGNQLTPPTGMPSYIPLLVPTIMYIHSFELRELEAKLKAAYLNKERAAQLAEKDTLKKKEEVREEEGIEGETKIQESG